MASQSTTLAPAARRKAGSPLQHINQTFPLSLSLCLSRPFRPFSARLAARMDGERWGPSSLCPGGGGPYSIPFELGGLCAAAAAISLWLFLLSIQRDKWTCTLLGGGTMYVIASTTIMQLQSVQYFPLIKPTDIRPSPIKGQFLFNVHSSPSVCDCLSVTRGLVQPWMHVRRGDG